MVLVGEHDALVAPVHSRRLAEHIGAPLYTIPGGGHDLSIDAREIIARLIVAQARDQHPEELPLGDAVALRWSPRKG